MADAGLTVKAVPPVSKPDSAPKPTLGGLESTLGQETAQAKNDITGYQDSLAKLTGDFHTELGKLKELAPQAPGGKPFEAPEQVNPLSGFGSSAGLLAGIASAFSRRPLTTSLNALSSGMKAIQEGNATNYQRAFDEWKANTDYAFKVFDSQNKSYDSLINMAKTDYDAATNGIKTLAAMTDDKAMLTANEMKGIEGVEQLSLERMRLANEMQTNAAKMIPAEIFNQSLKEYKIKNGKDPDSQTMSNLWQQAQTGGAGGIMGTAQMIADYKIPMPNGYALKNMGGASLVAAVNQLNPGYSAPKYNALNKAYADFSDGPSGKLISSGNVAIQHLGLLREAANALKNGDIQMFNGAKQKWLQATGSPLPTNFDGISSIAADELVKFIVGGGKAGGALKDREDMKATLSRSASQGQLDGQLDSYIGLMAGQIAGQRKRYDENELDKLKPFDDWLLPETQQALASHGGGKSSDDFSHLWK